MPAYRGFTVSFNAIGAGKTVRKYLLIASYEMLTPLLLPANKNMIEAKAMCQLLVNTRAIFRRGALDTWVKYQLVVVIAPSLARHAQAKKMLENILPGSVVLQEYRDTARTRVQCNEFVPDNKRLVFGFQRNGINHHRYGEVFDLTSPSAPFKNKETNRPIFSPWQVSKRERKGVYLPGKTFPLHRKLNMISLLDMLLLGVEHDGDENKSNRGKNASNALGIPRSFLTRRRPSAAWAAAADAAVVADAAAAQNLGGSASTSFGLK